MSRPRDNANPTRLLLSFFFFFLLLACPPRSIQTSTSTSVLFSVELASFASRSNPAVLAQLPSRRGTAEKAGWLRRRSETHTLHHAQVIATAQHD
ncbi:hypothetical protein B0T22DRAFT_450635 [Podospora appendiculata]|uniref:Secreted protein n=1 Tax=Podospora appendiculata TaxID=314037 RepID=A0AAE1CGH6_9PEZI|nr:hypothetical protein B0T22DRAFT_450635 [Podospora appendiculata]